MSKKIKMLKKIIVITILSGGVLLLFPSCMSLESLFDIVWREFLKTIIIITGG